MPSPPLHRSAGGIYARYAAFFIPVNVFAFQTGISILLMPVIGGIGTMWGAVLGGVIFGIVEEELVASSPMSTCCFMDPIDRHHFAGAGRPAGTAATALQEKKK